MTLQGAVHKSFEVILALILAFGESTLTFCWEVEYVLEST